MYCIYNRRQRGDLNYNYNHEVLLQSQHQFSRSVSHMVQHPPFPNSGQIEQDAPASSAYEVSVVPVQGAYQTYTNQPDCPMFRAVVTQHAKQLVAAGIDHVLVGASSYFDTVKDLCHIVCRCLIQLNMLQATEDRRRSCGGRRPDSLLFVCARWEEDGHRPDFFNFCFLKIQSTQAFLSL